jgi:hypothetical protein
MLFETYQAGIVAVGAAHIQFSEASAFGILNGSPEQKRHSAQIMESRV